MRVKILIIVILSLFLGCSSQEKNQEKEVQRGASDIEITSEKAEAHETVKKHKKELEGDKKDFYYSLKDKKINTDKSDESYTRIDAQKRVKNQAPLGQIAEKKSANSPYSYVQIDLLKSNLSKNFIVKCSSCHDNYANGIIGPSLLHKDGEFIYNQLQAYKSKSKVNVLMKDLVNNMSDKELKDLSLEIAEFNKQIRKMDEEK